jgi:hypothetical protein
MVKVSDVVDLLKYHYNTDDIYIVQVTDRNGDDIQIWKEVGRKNTPFVESFGEDDDDIFSKNFNMYKGMRPYLLDYKIEFDCLLTFIVNDMYEDEQLDDLILSNMTLLMREVKLKNILE